MDSLPPRDRPAGQKQKLEVDLLSVRVPLMDCEIVEERIDLDATVIGRSVHRFVAPYEA